jgi:hypothetical protein
VRPEGLGKLKEFIHIIGSGSHDLPAMLQAEINIAIASLWVKPHTQDLLTAK